ncbi:MAG: hypothetical protein AAFR98_10795 [Pseudomonadota bacterium]
MTSDDDPEGEALGDVRATRQLLRLARDELLNVIDGLDRKEGLEARAKDLSATMSQYVKAAQQAIEAERRFAKYSDEVAPLSDNALDLDSARRETLERLARLASAHRDQ